MFCPDTRYTGREADMRTFLLLMLTFSMTGCSWLRCRTPFQGGGRSLNVTSCEQKGDTLHVTVQQPCGPQTACLSGNACGTVAAGTVGCRKALTLGWLRIPIPFPKIQRIPTCQQVVVPGCQPNTCSPAQVPLIESVGEQPVPIPKLNPAPAPATATTQMDNRARQLEDQVRRLREVLNRQAQARGGHVPDTSRPDTPILPPPQRWGPADGVPAFTQSPIEQLSGSSTPQTRNVEPWPYSPQNPHRRAGQ